MTSSWGAVLIPGGASDPTSAIQLADVRMYEHKDAGRISAGSQVSEALLITLEERQPELGRHVHGVADAGGPGRASVSGWRRTS